MEWGFFREFGRGYIVKCKQITNFTRFSENPGEKTCEIKSDALSIFAAVFTLVSVQK